MIRVHGNNERGDNVDERIFPTLKQMLLGNSEDTDFDTELKVHINKSFTNLFRVGVGSSEFRIVTGEETWESFIDGVNCMGSIKDYIYLDVKLIFDPPTSSSVLQAFEKARDEALWTIQTEMELNNKEDAE